MSKIKKKALNGGDIESNDIESNESDEGKKGGRKVIILVNDEEVSRLDYIRNRWAAGASRGEIAAELTELQGKTVPYQIVFAATKGLEGGPVKNQTGVEIGEED